MASHGVPRVSGAARVKSAEARAKEAKQISQYKALEDDVRNRIATKDFSNDTFQLTSTLLTQNPEYYTIWNYRRRLLQHVIQQELDSSSDPTTLNEADALAARTAGHTLPQQEISLLIQEDLRFLIPLLRQFPKCYWIWNHRAWLLSTATTHLPSITSTNLWRAELQLVSKMLALDSRNFHGWGYRREVIQSIEKLSGESMVESEFEYTTKMIQTNLSNFSAWHNRGQLLPRLLTERNADAAARRAAFDEEFELITTALYTDSYDQSLWFYHEYLMSALDETNPKAPEILVPCTDEERLGYLDRELGSVEEMLDGAEDCKYIYQALLTYSARRHAIQPDVGRDYVADGRRWLDELNKLDPLRAGRWKDNAAKLVS